MNKKLILLYFCICGLIGCSDKKVDYGEAASVVHFNLEETEKIQGTGLIDSIDIIRLENDVVIGKISKIIKHDNRLYLLDTRDGNCVTVYDLAGKFVKEIADKGQGPNEYTELRDMFIDADNNCLVLFCTYSRKLLKYSLDDLECIGVQRLSHSLFYITNTSDGHIGDVKNQNNIYKNHNVVTLSKSLDIEAGFFKSLESWRAKVSTNSYPFSMFKNKIYCIQPHDFNIYSIEKDKCTIPFRFDLGENTWPSDKVEYDEVQYIDENYEGKYVDELYLFQETQNHLIGKLLFRGQILLVVYDKNHNQSYTTTLSPYTDKYFISFGSIIGADEKAIYTLVDAKDVEESIIGKNEYNDFESEYPEQIKNMREKFKDISIDEEDNPFLIMHYIN